MTDHSNLKLTQNEEVAMYMRQPHNCGPTLEYMAEHTMNMRLYDSRPSSDRYLVFWHSNLTEDDWEEVLSHRSICTKVPGDYIYMDKGIEYRCLNFVKQVNPDLYQFHLPSWVLPLQEDQLAKTISSDDNTLFIAKPVDDEKGNGIFLFKTMSEYKEHQTAEDMVVQKYEDNAHLINNRKYNMWVYVTIHGVSPQKAYVHPNSIMHFCTEEFDLTDYSNSSCHNTN